MWVALKIIGIVLVCAVVLAAALLLFGLFYPVHYRAGAEGKNRNIFCRLHAWWLLSILTLDAQIEQKTLEFWIKLCGITILKDRVEDVAIIRPFLEALFRDPEEGRQAAASNMEGNIKAGSAQTEDSSEGQAADEAGNQTAEPARKKGGSQYKPKTKAGKLIRQIVKDLRIAGIKLSSIRSVLQTELGRRAIHSVKTQGRELLKLIKPYIIKGHLHYGLEDAAQTALLYTLFARLLDEIPDNEVNVQMDFLETGLDLELNAEGTFQMKPVLAGIFRLIEDKDVGIVFRALRTILDV